VPSQAEAEVQPDLLGPGPLLIVTWPAVKLAVDEAGLADAVSG
jgi:hypothetical protein